LNLAESIVGAALHGFMAQKYSLDRMRELSCAGACSEIVGIMPSNWQDNDVPGVDLKNRRKVA